MLKVSFSGKVIIWAKVFAIWHMLAIGGGYLNTFIHFAFSHISESCVINYMCADFQFIFVFGYYMNPLHQKI